ncbi:TMhelix containing protein [Vibrio phage 1.170.O._10N.261.52.C3]|nr:TMhelix containing protein [Vibrio phage 1.170.O._10N.261.52.C3]
MKNLKERLVVGAVAVGLGLLCLNYYFPSTVDCKSESVHNLMLEEYLYKGDHHIKYDPTNTVVKYSYAATSWDDNDLTKMVLPENSYMCRTVIQRTGFAEEVVSYRLFNYDDGMFQLTGLDKWEK